MDPCSSYYIRGGTPRFYSTPGVSTSVSVSLFWYISCLGLVEVTTHPWDIRGGTPRFYSTPGVSRSHHTSMGHQGWDTTFLQHTWG